MDIRSRRTLAMIRKSFIELIAEKPFHEIRLKEVCEKAGIHRSTFYKHYEDIYDWRDRIERESLHYLREKIDTDMQPSELRAVIVRILTDMRDDADIVTTMLSDHWESDIIERIIRTYLEESGALAKFTETVSDDELDYRFFVLGSIGMVRSWQEQGMVRPIEEVADRIVDKMELMSGQLFTAAEGARTQDAHEQRR